MSFVPSLLLLVESGYQPEVGRGEDFRVRALRVAVVRRSGLPASLLPGDRQVGENWPETVPSVCLHVCAPSGLRSQRIEEKYQPY